MFLKQKKSKKGFFLPFFLHPLFCRFDLKSRLFDQFTLKNLLSIKKKNHKILSLFALILVFNLPLQLKAKELSSPLFLSQGGAGGASLEEDFSYLINPATMGFQKKIKGALSYSFKQSRQTALVSFADLKSKFPLAISYQRFWSDSFKDSARDKMLLSSGFKISPSLSFGFSAERETKPSAWNGGLGSVFKWSDHLSLALFLNRILEVEEKSQRSLSFAVYHQWKNFFSARVDISLSAHQKWVFRGGLETLLRDFLSLRLGGAWIEKTSQTFISGGLVLTGPKMLLEYSVEKDQSAYQQALSLILRI